VTIEVDGGIDKVTAVPCARAGARIFVAGSAVFGAERPWEAVEEIRAAIVGALDSRPVDGDRPDRCARVELLALIDHAREMLRLVLLKVRSKMQPRAVPRRRSCRQAEFRCRLPRVDR